MGSLIGSVKEQLDLRVIAQQAIVGALVIAPQSVRHMLRCILPVGRLNLAGRLPGALLQIQALAQP